MDEMTALCELAIRHGTDKKSKHNYTPVYDCLLGKRRESVKSVMEIGIKRGASLRMWQDYFPNAMIAGLDIKPKNLFDEGRIKSFLADQRDSASLIGVASAWCRAHGSFDFVVDDGSHHADLQANAVGTLLKFMSPDGIYVIEDVRHGTEDNFKKTIVPSIGPDHSWEFVMTNDMWDSGLLIVRQK